jgi:hypothetical protein
MLRSLLYENDLPTKQTKTTESSWLYGTNVDIERPQRFAKTPDQRTQAPSCLMKTKMSAGSFFWYNTKDSSK